MTKKSKTSSTKFEVGDKVTRPENPEWGVCTVVRISEQHVYITNESVKEAVKHDSYGSYPENLVPWTKLHEVLK